MTARTLWIAVMLAVFPSVAWAQCTSPPGAESALIYNTAHRVLQWCDGTAWWAAGYVDPAGPNDGCEGPAGEGGDIVFNIDHKLLQYCDGDHWQGVGGGVDIVPAGFSFTDLTDQALSAQVLSNIVTITGIEAPADVSISGEGSPQFRINGGSWVTSGTIHEGDTLQLRLTTSAALSTTRTASVVIGMVAASWGASTVGADTIPDAFTFTDRTDAATNTQILSNTITIVGISASTNVSVSGGGTPQISINGGPWVTSGSISNGQTLQVRLTSAASDETTLSATVTVGGVSDQWDVMTAAPVTAGQQAFITSGPFIVPPGVTSISAVCVGGGGGKGTANIAGRGGDLRYAISLPVTPSESLTVTVGTTDTGASTIKRGATVLLSAASGAHLANTVGTSSTIGGNIGGGNGGAGSNNVDNGGAGGGAGGYSGNGGNGAAGGAGSGFAGSGGGGGGGGSNSGRAGGGGGGVGLLGQGANGAGASDATSSAGGGSSGANGSPRGGNNNGGNGGSYGGGGGEKYNGIDGVGSPGACRIIWGAGRAYPSTNTADAGGDEDEAGGGPVLVGGYYWWAGTAGQSCDAVCAAAGRTCNLTGTKNYAGSAGTDANCQAVANALGRSGFEEAQNNSTMIGCAWIYVGNYRATGTATTCSASSGMAVRFCACNVGP